MFTLRPELSQPSTYRGIIMILGAFGIAIKPEVQEAIVASCMALAGLIGVFGNDSPSPKE